MKLFGSHSAEWTTANITNLLSNPAWLGLEKRLQAELEKVEAAIENPDPFLHGEAVGRRRAIKLVLALPEMLRDEAGGKSPVRVIQ